MPAAIDPIQLTRDLVAIESPSYHEGAMGEFLAGFLRSRGWEVEKMPVPPPSDSAPSGPRWNVYAGSAASAPEVVLSTHMDTVPPYI
ncbi:MAG: peptidase dimerization protein, partial [Terracidiphilus sp.]